MSRTILVIPCYNEEERLDLAEFQRFVHANRQVDLLFVNDGSTDRTLEVLQKLSRQVPFRIHVLDLEQNVGKAEAVRQGMLCALEQRPGYAGFLDADLATPLDESLRLLQVLCRREQIDLAVGVRLSLSGHSIRRKAIRQRLGRCFSAVASFVLGLSLRDTQCGAKLFRANELSEFLFSEPFRSRWLFDVELVARYLIAVGKPNASSRVYELPLDAWSEVPGSKLKSADFVKAVWELAVIYWEYFTSSRWEERYRNRRRWIEEETPQESEAEHRRVA